MTGHPRRALVMAGGTGGHIFPGLAVAQALRERGWIVSWLGGKGSATRPTMESQLVPRQGFSFEALDFSGVRGKGALTLALLPMRLLRAFWQSLQIVRRVRPHVVVGLGGYITFPGGMMDVLAGNYDEKVVAKAEEMAKDTAPAGVADGFVVVEHLDEHRREHAVRAHRAEPDVAHAGSIQLGAQADAVQHLHRVGAHLDARADFAQLRRLLGHAHAVPALLQHRGCGQTTQAGTDDQDVHHRRLNRV